MLFTHVYIMEGKYRTLVCFFSKQRILWRSIHNLYIKKLTKTTHQENEPLNMLFHRCSCKDSGFSEVVYNFTVPVLMICSFIDVFKDLALDFVLFSFADLLLVYIAYPLIFATIDFLFISRSFCSVATWEMVENMVYLLSLQNIKK